MFLVASDLPGQLWIMPCPGANGLEQSIAAFKAEGVDAIVSLLPADEMDELGVAREAELCADRGVAFLSHPVADFSLPEEAAFLSLIKDIARRLRLGQGIAVHCRAGIGRSGMTTAGALVALGLDSATAIDKVSRARGVSIPDTVEQAVFIAGLPNLVKQGVTSAR